MSEAIKSWQSIHRELAGSQQNYIAQLKDCKAVQSNYLIQLIKRNVNSSFGQKYQFSKIKSINDFIQTIPVHSYEMCLPYLDPVAADPFADIICFEETGGSTQGSKLIPYTPQSLLSFQKALFPWLDDLLEHRPNIKKGTAYWAISPVIRARQRTSGGHSIGLANDAVYFGNTLAGQIGLTLAVSPQIAEINNLADWRYQTLRALLLAEDLSFISVWSPSFLLELIQYLPTIAISLLDDIQQQNAFRASFLKPLIVDLEKLDMQKIWPNLDTISCWTDGAASGFIPGLHALFPHAYIQGKGLLATEGIVTIPLTDAQAPVLAITSGFYEFIDQHQQFKLAHELETGMTYTVLLSNDSGLYRYNLGDKVRMEGYFHSTPMLSFMGRGELCSDLCGEKLTDAFITETFAAFKALKGFALLYPTINSKPHYVLVTQSALDVDIKQLDNALGNNSQYRYAQELGQLGALQHLIIADALNRYTQWQYERGQCLGDIKLPSLIKDDNLIRALHEPI